MQQRRLRLGDILDDYCPRERRITNHAVVAMIDDEVKQTRCTTCDADHEYKEARVPARRKKDGGVLAVAAALAAPRPRVTAPEDVFREETPPEREMVAAAELPAEPPATADEPPPSHEPEHEPQIRDDDGPVHRRLIRATLPRPEGQPPEWKEPEFTIRQPGGGRNGHRPGHGRGPRRGQRQGNMRHGSGQQGHGPHRAGNHGRPGQHGHGQGHGQHRPHRPGGGRKRGR